MLMHNENIISVKSNKCWPIYSIKLYKKKIIKIVIDKCP